MTTSKKVSELPSLASLTADDLVYIVNDPSGVPESFKSTVGAIFSSNVAANGHLGGTLTANAVSARYSTTPANSSAVPAGFSVGTIWSDGSYVYVVTASDTLKRVAISSW